MTILLFLFYASHVLGGFFKHINPNCYEKNNYLVVKHLRQLYAVCSRRVGLLRVFPFFHGRFYQFYSVSRGGAVR